MKYIDDILHQLFLRRQLLVLHDLDLHVELLAEPLKPVESEPDKTVLMRHEDKLDLIFHDIIQELIPFFTIIVQAATIISDDRINNQAFGICVLLEKIHLIL